MHYSDGTDDDWSEVGKWLGIVGSRWIAVVVVVVGESGLDVAHSW